MKKAAPIKPRDDGVRLGPQVVRLLIGVGALIVLAYFIRHGGNFEAAKVQPAQGMIARTTPGLRVALCGETNESGPPVAIQMVYSIEKRNWIEFAANRFESSCPNIQIKLTAMEDLNAAESILSGRVEPTLWAPTDELSLRYLDSLWEQQRGGRAPFHAEEKLSLLESPLVILIWQDRLRAQLSILRDIPSRDGQWMRSICPLVAREPKLDGMPIEKMVPGTWQNWAAPLRGAPPAPKKRKNKDVVEPLLTIDPLLPPPAELSQWGQVKLSHAKPTSSIAGATALYLMALDYLLPPGARAAIEKAPAEEPAPSGELPRIAQSFAEAFKQRREALSNWLKACEAGLEDVPNSVDSLTEDMFNLGPLRYDGVVTYEHLAIPFLDRLDKADGQLRKMVAIYPEPTRIARHPVVLFQMSQAQREAARRWLGFLLSREMQEKAIEWGFRPGNPEVTIASYETAANPLLRLRRYGIVTKLQFIEAPAMSGQILRELLELWAEATGRN